MVYFGSILLSNRQIFFESSLCLGIVNIKPIVPGHVLLIPKRVCPRLHDLTPIESADLFQCVYQISPILEKYYQAEALNIAIQDGKVAGQSVPHVHVHLLPRKLGDFKRNDDVYEHLENQNLDKAYNNSNNNNNNNSNNNNKVQDPDRRVARSLEEMAEEANILKSLFPANQPNLIELENLKQK